MLHIESKQNNVQSALSELFENFEPQEYHEAINKLGIVPVAAEELAYLFEMGYLTEHPTGTGFPVSEDDLQVAILELARL